MGLEAVNKFKTLKRKVLEVMFLIVAFAYYYLVPW